MGELVAIIFGWMASIGMLPTSFMLQDQANQTTTMVVTAQEETQVLNAAIPFVQQNLSTVQSAATATTPFKISVSQLLTANLGSNGLPSGFSSTNPYGQTWQVQVLQPTAGNLNIYVVGVGGQKLTDLQGAGVAGYAGLAGGLIPQNDSGVYPAGFAYGSNGGWRMTTAGLQGVTGGQPVAFAALNNGQQQNPYLYRVAVPGQPQLTTMETTLNMGANQITNANGVVTAGGSNAQSYQVGNVWYYGDTVNAAIRTNGGLFVQNTAGTAAADIAEVGNINSTGNVVAAGTVEGSTLFSTGNLQVNGSSQVNGNSNTSGQVSAGSNVVAGGYVIVSGAASAGAACPGPQFIGASPTGTMLCELVNGSFQWKAGLSSTTIVSGPPSFGESSSGPHNSMATCPAGTLVTGGGYSMVDYIPNTSFNALGNAPDMSMPMGNGWFVQPGGFPGSSEFIPYAVCAS